MDIQVCVGLRSMSDLRPIAMLIRLYFRQLQCKTVVLKRIRRPDEVSKSLLLEGAKPAKQQQFDRGAGSQHVENGSPAWHFCALHGFVFIVSHQHLPRVMSDGE